MYVCTVYYEFLNCVYELSGSGLLAILHQKTPLPPDLQEHGPLLERLRSFKFVHVPQVNYGNFYGLQEARFNSPPRKYNANSVISRATGALIWRVFKRGKGRVSTPVSHDNLGWQSIIRAQSSRCAFPGITVHVHVCQLNKHSGSNI